MSTSPQNGTPAPVINRTELVHSEKWICMKKLHWTDQRGRNRVRPHFGLKTSDVEPFSASFNTNAHLESV